MISQQGMAMTFLKFLFSALIFAMLLGPSPSEAANNAKCEEAKRDSDILVRDLQLSCTTLKQCLVRRDTCVVEGFPNTEAKCQHMDECMKSRDKDFNDFATCQYRWRMTGNKGDCSLKKVFAPQDRCPGRIMTGFGLMGMALFQADIIDYSVDGEFNCDASNKHFIAQSKALDRALVRIRTFCVEGQKQAKQYEKPVCEESKKFKKISDGQHALPPQGTTDPNIREGSGGESGSGNEGGGEESGGGGGPKKAIGH